MKWLLFLFSILLLSGCLGRYSKPPQVTLRVSPFDGLPDAIQGVRVGEGFLLAWGGPRLLIRSATGRILRKFPAEVVSAAVAGGRVAVVLLDQRVLLLDTNGKTLSPAAGLLLPEPIPVPVTPYSGGFLLCGNRGGVYALSFPGWSPVLLWKAKKGIAAPPRVDGSRVTVVSFSREMALFTNAGSPVSTRVLPAIPDTTPLLVRGGYVFSTRSLRLLRMDPSSGKIAASRPIRSWVNGLISVDGRALYRTWHGDLVALDPLTLQEHWRYRSAMRLTLPLVRGYTLFAGGHDGRLRALFRPNGRLMGSVRLGDSQVLQPFLFEGHLLAACGPRIFQIVMKRIVEPVY